MSFDDDADALTLDKQWTGLAAAGPMRALIRWVHARPRDVNSRRDRSLAVGMPVHETCVEGDAMRRLRIGFATFVALAWMCSAAQAQPSFAGTWKLNLA